MSEPINTSVVQFFRDYKPPQIVVSNDERELKIIKTIQVNGFISGELKSLLRNNDNLINRDCIILDLDDITVTEKELLKAIHGKFKKYTYIAYPSISHGLKGVRYRLVIPLSRPVVKQEYRSLVEFFYKKIIFDVIQQVDESNYTWSQLMLLPVLTQHIKQEQITIHDGKVLFPVDESLQLINKNTPRTKKYNAKNLNQFRNGGSRYRTTTTELIESLVTGCATGNRNTQITKITGGLLARAVNVKAILELVKVANSYFDEPLSDSEVEATFYSIVRKELQS